MLQNRRSSETTGGMVIVDKSHALQDLAHLPCDLPSWVVRETGTAEGINRQIHCHLSFSASSLDVLHDQCDPARPISLYQLYSAHVRSPRHSYIRSSEAMFSSSVVAALVALPFVAQCKHVDYVADIDD